MHQEYGVTYQGNTVGSVTVSREGLYYIFNCRVILPGSDIYKLILCKESEYIELGVLIPVSNRFELQKRLPVKQAGKEDFVFEVSSKQETFVPVNGDKPFEYINQLNHARFAVRNHIAYIVLDQSHSLPATT